MGRGERYFLHVGLGSHHAPARLSTLLLIALALSACAVVSGIDGYSADGDESAAGDGGAYNPNANLPKGVSVPSEVVLNDVRCGDTAVGRLTITNDADKAIPFEAILPDESIVKFAGGARTKNDTLGARSKLEIELTASSPVPGPVVESVAIFVGPERIAGAVTVRFTTNGPLLTVSSVIGFGEVRQNTTPPAQSIEFENTGNEAITISGAQNPSPDFTLASGPVVVGPGEKKSLAVSFIPGPAGPQVESDVTLETTPAACNVVPKVKLSGWRVNQSVTVNPATHSFGDVDCKASTALGTKTITVSNYSTNQIANAQLTLSGGGSSFFTITPTSGTVPQAANSTTPGTTTFTVGLKSPVSAMVGAHPEQVQVVLTGPESGTKMVDLSVNIVGAVLDITPAPPAILSVGSGAGRTFDVKNNGNKAIRVDHQSSTNTFIVSPDESTVSPSQTVRPNVRYTGSGGFGGTQAQITTVRENSPLGQFGQLCNTPAVVSARR
jgi:hypothetical protein